MITTLRLRIVGMSAIGGSLITGGVSHLPRTAVGFVFALERKLKAAGLTLGSTFKVAVGVDGFHLHATKLHATTAKMSLSLPWEGVGKRVVDYRLSVLDHELKADASVTLAILSNGYDDPAAITSAIGTIVPSMRFAGGSIFMTPHADISSSMGDDAEALQTNLRAIRSGKAFFFVDRSDLIEEGREIPSLIDAISPFSETAEDEDPTAEKAGDDSHPKTEEKAKPQLFRKYPGWIIPLERGYQGITPPVAGRPGARCMETPSVVAGALISLGELVSRKQFLSNLSLPSFWRSSSDPSRALYVYAASSFND